MDSATGISSPEYSKGYSKISPRRNDSALEDWDLFVLRHQNNANIVTHIISFALFWFSPVLALVFSPFWWIGFFSSGFVGTLGHYVFKDGVVDFREATSRWQVVYYSSCMIILFLSGAYEIEKQISFKKYDLYLSKKIPSIADPNLFTKIR